MPPIAAQMTPAVHTTRSVTALANALSTATAAPDASRSGAGATASNVREPIIRPLSPLRTKFAEVEEALLGDDAADQELIRVMIATACQATRNR